MQTMSDPTKGYKVRDQRLSLARSETWMNSVNAHRLDDVFQELLADILKRNIQLARGIFLHTRRHASSTGAGETFMASGDIHPVAQ